MRITQLIIIWLASFACITHAFAESHSIQKANSHPPEIELVVRSLGYCKGKPDLECEKRQEILWHTWKSCREGCMIECSQEDDASYSSCGVTCDLQCGAEPDRRCDLLPPEITCGDCVPFEGLVKSCKVGDSTLVIPCNAVYPVVPSENCTPCHAQTATGPILGFQSCSCFNEIDGCDVEREWSRICYTETEIRPDP